jgi:predicted nucleotidyltransferase
MATLSAVFEGLRPGGTVAAYVYGSHAEERAHAESDVDVGVLLDRRVFSTAAQRFEERVHLSALITAEAAVRDLDLVVLNDVPPLLGRRIVTTGRRIYCSDRDLEHAFVRDVQLRAADLVPFLRRTRQVKLTALAR